MHSPEHEGTEEGGDDSMTQLLILVVTPAFRIVVCVGNGGQLLVELEFRAA